MDEEGFDFNIAIVGLGLIGGSYAKALKALKSKTIIGIDVNKEVVNKALSMGIIDEGYCESNEVLKKADLIIIALYPEVTIKFVKDNVCNFKSGALITDTCGIKEMVVKEINSLLPEDLEFVGGHPMAGKEAWGLEAASEDIFRDANYIITPSSRNNEKSIITIEKIAKAIGCRNVVRVEAKEHDRIMCLTSQLPHAIAVSLMNSKILNDETGLFVGGSFRDATRVAAINSELWSQLFTLNSDNLIDEIESFEEALADIKRAVKSQNKNALEGIFASAREKRRMML